MVKTWRGTKVEKLKEVLFLFGREERNMLKIEKEEHRKDQELEKGKREEE